LSFLPFWSAWTHGPSHYLQFGGVADDGQEIFFLAQFPEALVHGLNPFANTWTNWPYGANYMVNTAVPLLALLMSPVTLLTNPILSANLLFTLTVWADCLVGYLVVQYFIRNRLAAFVAGLLFGFSPMVTAAAYGHVHVMFDLLPPVMFLLLWRLCVGTGRPLWNGVALGVSMAVQLYVFAEPLGACVVVAGVGLAAAAIVYRRRLAERLLPFLRGAAAAVLTFVILGGYGVYLELDGPHHIKGSPHPGGFFTLVTDLLGPVIPSNNERFTFGLASTGAKLTGVVASSGTIIPDGAENGAYIGIPLLVILIVGLVWLWRRPLMRWAAGLAIVALVFSMGPKLRVDTHTTPIRLPFDILAHLPLLQSAVPARYAMIEWFFLALMLGMVLAEIHRFVRTRRRRERWGFIRGPSVATLAVVVVAVVGLLPLLPSWPYEEAAVDLPSLAVGPQLRSLPVGAVVLGFPFPTGNTYMMVIQAEDRMRFRLVGGSLIQPWANGRNQDSGAPPSACQDVLNVYYLSTQPAILNPGSMEGCAANILAWNVKAVLWTDIGAQPAGAKAFFTALLGPPTVSATDSALWLDPQPAAQAVVADHGVTAFNTYKSLGGS
jgi:hypothetical protein